jgi:ribokinase
VTRVVCAGHVNWDVTLRVERLPDPDGEAAVTGRRTAGGGSASNTAAALSGLGVDAALLGSVGDDEYGRLARAELAEAGVDCTALRTVVGAPTAVKYLVVDGAGQVMVLADDGANEAFAATDLNRERLAAADLLHLTGQDPRTAAELARRAAAVDVPVSVDPGRRVGDRDFTPAVSRADYVFVNGREAEAARTAGLTDGLDGVTVVTRGDGGGEVRTDDGVVRHPGFDVDAVDTAGAGDAFAAGFLRARLDGADYATALSTGNACGALASRTVGARTSLSRADVERFRDERSRTDGQGA